MGDIKKIREQQQLLMDTMTSMRKLNMSILSPKLSHVEFGTLKCITKCGKRTETKVSDVVKTLGAPAPAVSRTLKNLENKGYIERTVDKDDRRNTIVAVTEDGNAALKETMDAMWEFADAVFENMGEDSLVKLNGFMKQLLEAAEHELDKRKNEQLERGTANE